MTPRAPFLLAVALAVAGGAPAFADGPAPVDLSRRDAWKPGDVVTEALEESESQSFKISSEEGKPATEVTRSSSTSVATVRKCLEADLDGNLLRSVVWFRSFALDNGKSKDESLKGAFVRASGRAKDRAYVLVPGATPPSDAAKNWLERTYGPARPDAETSRRIWLPKVPVAVGDSWTPDLAAVLDAWYAGKPVDRAKATSSCRLASAEKGVAKVECKASIPLTSMAMKKDAKPLPWTSGGIFTLAGEVTLPLEKRLGGGAFLSQSLEGEAADGGKTVVVSLEFKRRAETSIGGEMPAPPEEPAAPLEPGAPPPAPPAPDPAMK